MSVEQQRTSTCSYDVEAASSTSAATSNFTVAYSVHTPTSSPPVSRPILVLCHPFNNARAYWQPQLADEAFSSYTKVVLDAVGFGHSTTHGRPWSFDLAAHSVLTILDELEEEGVGQTAVVIGDSMGAAHTGLRVALQDAARVKSGARKQAKVLGVVCCGTAAEEESTDFVEEYTQGALDFGKQCHDPSVGVEQAIKTLAANMCDAGYTASFPSQKAYGQTVIEASLRLALTNDKGELEPDTAARIMLQNYNTLNYRRSLIPHLASRPSRLGDAQVLVVHGTAENAYPFDRKYHERTASAIGEQAEIYVVQGGPHFVTATHWEEVDAAILDWMKRKGL